MSQTTEEKKAVQAAYYVELNEILVKVQTEAIKPSAGEDAIDTLNERYPNVSNKASICIIEAMRDEYANFDENSNC